MFRHRLDSAYSKRASLHWFLLAFLAGCVNVGGFLACARFVTHVTGFATMSGLALARGQWLEALAVLTVPLYFLAGVMIAAWLTERRRQTSRAPDYATTMGLVALCLLVAAAAGRLELFGAFGDGDIKHDYLLLALLCMASGLQNAAVTTSSGSTVRTTHLTGITTDLGIGLVQALTLRKRPSGDLAMRRNRLRLGTILSFALGGAVGALTFERFHYLGFLLPAALALYAMRVARHDGSAAPLTNPPDQASLAASSVQRV